MNCQVKNIQFKIIYANKARAPSKGIEFTKGWWKQTAAPGQTEGVRKCCKCAEFNRCPEHPSFPPGWSFDHWAVPSPEQWFAEPDHTVDIFAHYQSFYAPFPSSWQVVYRTRRPGCLCRYLSPLATNCVYPPMGKNAWTSRKEYFLIRNKALLCILCTSVA